MTKAMLESKKLVSNMFISCRSPALTIKTALVSLQALLSVPEPNDPQDAQVASQYLKDKKAFEETAKNWTETYATNKGEMRQETLQRLINNSL